MDYQINELFRAGYERNTMSDYLDFDKVFDVGEVQIYARITVDWNDNPDKVLYHSIVAVRDTDLKDKAVWYSEKTSRFGTIIKVTEQAVKFAGDLVREGK